MMKPYLYVLVWLVAGALLGGFFYLLFLQPPLPAGPVESNTTLQNGTPLQNATLPAGNATGQNATGAQNGTQAQKAKVNITMIEAPGCDACNSEGFLLEQTKTVLIQSLYFETGAAESIPASGARAQSLISKYGITELPAIIIEGPVDLDSDFVASWKESVGTQESDGVLVTRLRYPPFYDVENRTVIGLIDAITIRASGCPQCDDPALFVTALEGSTFQFVFAGATNFEENDTGAKAIILQYNITRLPVLLLSAKDASAYPVYPRIEGMFSQEGEWLILRNVTPPYVDLGANRTIRGLVHSVYVVNSSCDDCYNVSALSTYISQASGLVITNETEYESDSSEGKALISEYNISGVPALLYSPEARYYPAFDGIWLSLNNTIEDDGWYVFRAYDDLNLKYQKAG